MIRAFVLMAAAIGISACGYNSIQTLEEKTDAEQGQIEAQLQRRSDLIPNLVEAVRGYAAHEDSVFSKVAQARAGLAGAIQSGDASKMAVANSEVTSALGRLIAIAEAYPQLRASEQFLRLQDELAGTENRIAVARQEYNKAVQEYNSYIRRFPAVVTAKVVGAKQRSYFTATSEAAREVPKVKFGKTG